MRPAFPLLNCEIKLRLPIRFCILINAVLTALASPDRGQALEVTSGDAVRVTVSLNRDGSRTIYEVDTANHKATATTRGRNGKLQGRIRYLLDDAGRFASGEVFGPDEQLRFKTLYKYSETGRLLEESQLDEDDSLRHKIKYAYDQLGKQTGYSVYDASGKLLSQTAAPAASPSPAKKKAR